MSDPRHTPASDLPPPDWRNHDEGMEDGFYEEWDREPEDDDWDEEWF